jgi:hypothetical protein
VLIGDLLGNEASTLVKNLRRQLGAAGAARSKRWWNRVRW